MARILVIGSSNTDMTVRLPQLPGPGQTMLGGEFLRGPGGKGANQAVAASRAGGKVVFFTAVGDDPFGRQALSLYRDEAIDVSHALVVPGRASGVALIFVGDDGENMIGVAPGANAALSARDAESLPDHLFSADSVLLVGGLEVPLDAVSVAVARAAARGMRVVLNPAPFHPNLVASSVLERVDVVTPNRGELHLLSGREGDDRDSLADSLTAIRERYPRLDIVVTLGSDGCLVMPRDGEPTRIAPHPVRAVDAVGAGDAFNGALAVALAEGRPLAEAAAWANAAAALAVTLPGAQSALPRRDEIDRLASSTLRNA